MPAVKRDAPMLQASMVSITAAEPIVDALTAYGERFMQMFDDYDEQQDRKQKHRARMNACEAAQQQAGAEKAQQQNIPVPAGKVADDLPSLSGQQITAGAEGRAGGGGRPSFKAAKQPRSTSEIDVIVAKQRRSRQGHVGDTSPSVPHTPFNQRAWQSGSAALMPGGGSTLGLLKAERKNFMSPKAGTIHEAIDPSSVALAAATRASAHSTVDMDANITAAQFRNIQMEVEKFGASALDKKERKRWESKMLERLGARKEKGIRMAAPLGYHMARSKAAQEARVQAEGVESGMLSKKTLSKQKKNKAAAAKQTMDHGLQEVGRGFRNGVLKLKGSPASTLVAAAASNRSRNGRQHL